MKYSFYNDYSEGVHPEILQYIANHNTDQQLGYGEDQYCIEASERIKQAFNVSGADVHFIPGGTSANVVGLLAMLKDYEAVISPASGHINTHETGALEATGRKILAFNAPDGKLTRQMIDQALALEEGEHTVKSAAVYLTQVTEVGTVYTPDELRDIIAYAKQKDLLVFVDGARLGMALVSKAGMSLSDFGALDIDIFTIGGTKNGGMFGEAVVIKNDTLKPYFRHRMKQRGVLMAKGRFMGQQFARFFNDDELWLNLAKHANDMAALLDAGLRERGVEFDLVADANQVFPILPDAVIEKLQKDYGFYEWQKIDADKTKIRLVCSWATQEENVREFLNDFDRLQESTS